MLKNQTDLDPSTGICMFAYNNEQIDYVKLSIIAALSVKRYMKNNQVALLTDRGTSYYIRDHFDKDLINRCFDTIIVEDLTHDSNPRMFNDSPWNEFRAQFSNGNKHNVFNLSPFEKTLLLDVDYIVQSNLLDKIFETDYDISLYQKARDLRSLSAGMGEQRLNFNGIDMWWSTVVYWKKSKEAKRFFDIWAHVKDNYDYYKFLYKFPGTMFRTDFASSIAIHLINGQNKSGSFVPELPGTYMTYADGKDDLIQVNKNGDIIFLSNDRDQQWKNVLVNARGMDVHCMNKRALLRHYDRFLELLA